MLAEKLREADQRAVSAESASQSGKLEAQSLVQRLEAAETESDRQGKAHRNAIQDLEARIAELSAQASRQTPERARPASAAAPSSPEGTNDVLCEKCVTHVLTLFQTITAYQPAQESKMPAMSPCKAAAAYWCLILLFALKRPYAKSESPIQLVGVCFNNSLLDPGLEDIMSMLVRSILLASLILGSDLEPCLPCSKPFTWRGDIRGTSHEDKAAACQTNSRQHEEERGRRPCC